jgi:hypothetical protein
LIDDLHERNCLMMKQSYRQLADILTSRFADQSVTFIAIDGPGASGKSTFAAKLQMRLPDSAIVRMDDFYLPTGHPQIAGSNFDWQRLLDQIVLPMQNGQPATYQVFDWDRLTLDTTCAWQHLPAQRWVIMEGVTASRRELRPYLQYVIFIETPRDMRLARGIARDGAESMHIWQDNWMPREDLYFTECHRSGLQVDLSVDGSDGFDDDQCFYALKSDIIRYTVI